MKISFNWLTDIIDTSLSVKEVSDLLTGCGLEVEGTEKYESVKGGLKGIVIGEIKTCEKHPNADKLKITTVDIGTGIDLHIVCGAPNAAAGQKVLIAPVGTIINPTQGEPFEIKKTKIRGEVSEGMICAEDELSLGKSHDGILVLPDNYNVGKPATDYFEVIEDEVLEIGLTANRGDAASHLGVARDLRALTGGKIKIDESTIPAAQTNALVQVEIKDTDCVRYSGISLRGITVKDSPIWMQNRLRAIGLNPINNIVDATNYVLHELGQPLHAFDSDKLSGKKIIVQKLPKGTPFITLDQVKRSLIGNECMICDSEKPVAIGGVFGGLDSGISFQTTNLFIESAYFDAASVRKTAKSHGLSTDASFRYERGTDPNITLVALARLVNLILEIAGGEVASDVIDIYPNQVAHFNVSFSLTKFNQLIGQHIPINEVKEILKNLEIEIKEERSDKLELLIPPYRSDVKREADVAEEILRIYGLNKIAIPQQLKSTLTKSADEQAFLLRNRLADYLSGNGFIEMLSNSITKSAYYVADELKKSVKLLNPLSSDLDMMRMNMIFNGLEMIQYNSNRKNSNIKAFEYGLTYETDGSSGKFLETPHLALYVTGYKSAESWNTPQQSVSIFTLKSFVQNLLNRAGISNITFQYDSANHFLNQACSITHGDKQLAVLGSIKSACLTKFDIEQPVYYADINWNAVKELAANTSFYPQQVSPYPAVRRDLALTLEKSVRYVELENIALKTAPSLIKQINVFDVYEGEKIENGKKSYALSFILQDDHKTLTDSEIDMVMKKLINRFDKELGATLRN
ncbi:MAG: phenylalanine--tRNA ligase subunit beta [Bacteroidota bacterium]|jgi:phenylalanyl-tRNA synthetase beta chain|nr:phenylalanine--tRNA ligase subunit beta [Sphingobacteriales bacterium]